MKTQSRAIGQRAVSADSIRAFADLTGDHSPVHVDPEFARASGFSGPIAHGLLTGAWALGALAQHAPTSLGAGDPESIVTSCSLRLSRVVVAGDELSFRLVDGMDPENTRHAPNSLTNFEVINQRDEVVASGGVVVRRDGGVFLTEEVLLRVEPLPGRRVVGPNAPEVYFAEDIVALGPRGTRSLAAVSQQAVQDYVEQTGEVNPLYRDEKFAASSCCKSKVVPPMLTFCLAFSEFLRELLTFEMPAEGSAGHIADTWQVHRPVAHSEPLRVVYQPITSNRTRSRPDLAIVQFGLEIIDANSERVQSGVVEMMIPGRPGA